MSEVQSRGPSTRGRGGFRGGRGGYRGSRGAKSHSKSEDQESGPPLEEQGEVGELKVKYADKLPLLREVAAGWSDEDLVFALQETNGDEAAALDRITSGTISQWGEVKKKPKAKDGPTSGIDSNSRGRGRGGLDSRGRGRTTERGSRGARGARAVSQANGTKQGEKLAKAADESLEESVVPTNGDTASTGEWANDPGKDKLESLETTQPRPAAAAAPGKSGGWASLFARPTPPPAAKKETPRSVVPETIPPPTHEPEQTTSSSTMEEPINDSVHVPPPIVPIVVDDGPSELPSAPHSDTGHSDIIPAKDALTEKNVHKLPDMSHPPLTATAASTAASTQDPVNPALPAAAAIRPGMSGHAASALRATTGAGRSASFTRKVMEQQEAVVMPGNHAVDRTAVQFGKMGLDGEDMDADEDREDPETRTQLLDDSPSAPRASLPPSMSEAPALPQAPPEPPTEPQAQRPAPGLPIAPQQTSPQPPAAYAEQYRYAQGQKPYDPFSQQPQHPQAATEPFSNQIPSQGQAHAQIPTSAQQEYAQFYAREYSQYYGGYGGQERAGSAFGSSGQDAQAHYATAGPRGYGSQELGASGNNTPNPNLGGHQAQGSQQMQQGPGSHAAYAYGGYGAGYGSAYPQYAGYNSHRYGSNRPMFDDVRRQEELYHQQQQQQYGYGHAQGYGGNYKSNMYGGPQHQYSHEYSSSPANAGSFGGREGSYGRSGSAQPSEAQQSASTGNNAFGSGMPDPFGRTPSGFGQSQHGSHGGSEDPAKPTGPSPSMQANRPGSGMNSGVAQQQGSLPHPQSGQQAFGAYPQYAGFGNQNTHNTGYGAYGSNNAFGGYGGGYGRGWTGNYGGGQH